MRRRLGALVPNEIAVLDVLGEAWADEWLTIAEIRERLATRDRLGADPIPTNEATTYRITARLVAAGTLERRWRLDNVQRPCREFRTAR